MRLPACTDLTLIERALCIGILISILDSTRTERFGPHYLEHMKHHAEELVSGKISLKTPTSPNSISGPRLILPARCFLQTSMHRKLAQQLETRLEASSQAGDMIEQHILRCASSNCSPELIAKRYHSTLHRRSAQPILTRSKIMRMKLQPCPSFGPSILRIIRVTQLRTSSGSAAIKPRATTEQSSFRERWALLPSP